MPMLITGPALSPEAANIFPADTELLLTMSLDLPQIYAAMSKPQQKQVFTTSRVTMVETKEIEPVSPMAAIEERLKIKLKDDLLPLLGSEIALRLPTESANLVGIPGIHLLRNSNVWGLSRHSCSRDDEISNRAAITQCRTGSGSCRQGQRRPADIHA